MCLGLFSAISVTVEAIQLVYPDRVTASWDVVANVVGAVAGCWIFRRLDRTEVWGVDPLILDRRFGVFAVAVYVVFVCFLSLPGKRPDFANWDPECRLTVRDELGRDRPWDGDIEGIVILSSCLGSETIGRLAQEDAAPAFDTAIRSGALVYEARLSDEPVPARGSPLLGPEARKRFHTDLVGSGSLSVLVWFEPRREEQSGPARIVSYSKAPVEQNFAIGQEGRQIIFRLRTGTTVPGGYFPQTETRDILRAGVPTFVAATYDGRNTRVYVDGKCEARRNLHAHGRFSPLLSDSGLPAVAVFLGALMGVGMVGAAGSWCVRRRWLIGSFGGTIGAIVFIVAGGVDALPEFMPWVPALGMWGGLMVAAAICPGSDGAPDSHGSHLQTATDIT